MSVQYDLENRTYHFASVEGKATPNSELRSGVKTMTPVDKAWAGSLVKRGLGCKALRFVRRTG